MNLRLLTGLTLVALGVACGDGSSSGNGGAAGSANTGAGGLGGSGLAGEGGLGGTGLGGTGGDGGGPANCLSGAVVCTPSDSCHVASCDPATGECVEDLKPDGALCSDGDACSFGETCLSGVCGVGEPLVCSGDATCTDGQCVAQACEGAPGAQWLLSIEAQWEPRAAATSTDLNGDGNVDVVIGNSSGLNIVASLGNGLFATPVNHPIGFVKSISIADIDADGSPDIVASIQNSSSLHILLNQGAGTFTLAGSYDNGTTIQSVALADFGGDGLTDIAVANRFSATITVFINQGNGTLSAQPPIPVGGQLSAVVAADVDGDGLIDLAAAASQSEQIGVLMNRGDNSFAPFVGQQYYDQFYNYAPYQLSAADFNDDGAVDLMAIALDGSPAGHTIYLENVGNGAFELAFELPTLFSPSEAFQLAQATITDLNNDGLPDAVVKGQVMINQGDFMFSTTPFDSPVQTWSSTAADFNEDGFTDVAFAQDRIVLGLNDGTGTLTDPSKYYTLPMGTRDEEREYLFVDTADFDNDGDFDVVASGVGPPMCFLNLGTGLLSSPIEIAGLDSGVMAVDIDSDGDADLIGFTYEGVAVVENMGGAVFSGPSVYSMMGWTIEDYAVADIDGDGLRDIIVSYTYDIGIMLNQGNGSFGPIELYPANGYAGDVVTGDFNGDGQEDVALADWGWGNVQVFLNQGGGVLGAALEPDTGTGIGLGAGDFNSDGLTDLVTQTDTGGVRVLLNTGSATFTSVDYAPPDGYYVNALETADLNADGALDLLMHVNEDSAAVLINEGDGSFGAAETYYLAFVPYGYSVAAADLDLNGLPDLIGVGYDRANPATARYYFLRVWQMECPP